MAEYQGVIFDFNGTLFFDNDKHVLAWNEISKILRNKEITDQELHEKFNGTPNEQIIRYMTDNQADAEEILKYSRMKESFYREYCRKDRETFHLVKGVTEYFDDLLNAGIPFTIASASIKENIDFFIESFHLDRWIAPDQIVYDDGTYENKIAMFKDASKKIGVPLSECRIYEDSYSGIRSGYEAGCRQLVIICEKEKEAEYQILPGVIETRQDFDGVTFQKGQN